MTSCIEMPDVEVKRYGTGQIGNDSLFVPVKLSEFENYGQLVERIRSIDCNDSIPYLPIESASEIRMIFPVAPCMPPPFNPKEKHYVSFSEGKAHYRFSSDPIDPDSLGYLLKKDFAYRRAGVTSVYLVIIESNLQENTRGLESFLTDLTQAYDQIETEIDLNVSLWQIVQTPPPPPPPTE